jgi:hypothetical protein
MTDRHDDPYTSSGRNAPSDPAWDRLQDQLEWYDRRSIAAERLYKRVKATEIVIATLVPVLAGLAAPAAVTASVAAIVVVLEDPAAEPVADQLGAVPVHRRTAET